MTQAALEKLFEENYRNCPPFVFRFQSSAAHRRWQFEWDPWHDRFHYWPMWTDGDFCESWSETFDLLTKPDALIDDQSFENWLLSWTSGAQIDTSQVEELL